MEWALTQGGIYCQPWGESLWLSGTEHPFPVFYLSSLGYYFIAYKHQSHPWGKFIQKWYFRSTPRTPCQEKFPQNPVFLRAFLTWASARKGELWWNWGVGSFEEEVRMGRSRKESTTGPSISFKEDHRQVWMVNISTSITFRRVLTSTELSGWGRWLGLDG